MIASNDVLIEIIPMVADYEGIFVLLPLELTTQGKVVDTFWLERWRTTEHPTDTVKFYLSQKLEIEPLILHSTSWRMANSEKGSAVILTYLAVMPEASRLNVEMAALAFNCQSLEIARGGTISPPREIRNWQVARHALEHLNMLTLTDEPIQHSLSPAWQRHLKRFALRGFLAQ
jgi:hypothetical protein